jgi:hypothetical protein
MLRRYAGLGPADLRADGGAALRAAFRTALAAGRGAPAPPHSAAADLATA